MEIAVEGDELCLTEDREGGKVGVHPDLGGYGGEPGQKKPAGFETGRFLKSADDGQAGEGLDQFRRILVSESLGAVGMENGRGGRESKKTLLGGAAEAGGILGGCLGEDSLRQSMMRVGGEGERQPDVGVKEHGRGVGGRPERGIPVQARAARRQSSAWPER